MSSEDGLVEALRLVDRLEQMMHRRESAAAPVLQEILMECGFWVSAREPARSEARLDVDMSFTGRVDDEEETVGVILKGGRGPVSGQTVYQALDIVRASFDRVLLVSTGGFSALALDRANTDRLGRLDLLTPASLRSWLRRQATPMEEARPYLDIVQDAMRELARRLAARPEDLPGIQWFDLERLLKEVFAGLGFETELTRPAMDGGFDLRLTDMQGRVVLVEVKHWTAPSRPGSQVLRNLIQVVATQEASAGLILSSSGFSGTIYEGLLEFAPPVRLGDGEKIISLCRAYARLRSELWQPAGGLLAGLFEGTQEPRRPDAAP